jgi:N-acetylmuramoyl-L-alanine amidase
LVRTPIAIAAGLLLWALAGIATAQTGAPAPDSDDAIAKLLKQGAQPATPAGPPPIVMSARIGEHEDRTRVVIEFSDPVNIRTFTLSNPDRVVIDMPQVAWHLGAPPRPSGFGPVKSYRYGLFRPGNSRIVVDLNQPVSVSDALVIPPSAGFGYRVVIDLFPVAQTKFDSHSGWPADLKAREAAAEQLAALPATAPPRSGAKKIIVIDPGHGGLDSGTSGVNGLLEKDLVLAEALRLKKALLARGHYIVHLTRDSDVFIPLPERVAIARNYHADLFISLHADSNPDADVTGLSIYTLSNSGSDKEAAALARKENQSDVIAGVDLSGENSAVAPILIDLAQRDTINKSVRFATTAVLLLSHATDILPREPHRSAGFAVLKGPDIPAVLVELGYLSNQSDAHQMNTDAWRAGVAEALAGAVDRQFSLGAAAPADLAGTPQ